MKFDLAPLCRDAAMSVPEFRIALERHVKFLALSNETSSRRKLAECEEKSNVLRLGPRRL